MKEFSREAERIMIDRFGKDTIVALATTENETPYVRYVNAYYEDGAFYIITHAFSNKMKHIKDNPVVAIAGEWFTMLVRNGLLPLLNAGIAGVSSGASRGGLNQRFPI